MSIRRPADQAYEAMVFKTIAYVDTLSLFSASIPKGTRTRIEEAHGRRIRFDHVERGCLISVGQPGKETIQAIDQLQREHGKLIVLNRVDVSADFLTRAEADAEQLRQAIRRTAILKHRRPGAVATIGHGDYWCTPSGEKGLAPRNLVQYADQPSKMTGGHCNHLELRFRGARSVRSIRLDDGRTVRRASDILDINPAYLFAQCISIMDYSERRATERRLHILRSVLAEDRERHDRNNRDDFLNRYRADMRHRIEVLLNDRNCAQRWTDTDTPFAMDMRVRPTSLLNLPRTLSFVPASIQGALKSHMKRTGD